MEAEACYLQARSREHRKASVPRSPTGSCLVSHSSCQLPSDRHTHTYTQGPVWFHIHPTNCLPTHTHTHTHTHTFHFLRPDIQLLSSTCWPLSLHLPASSSLRVSSPKSDPSCPQPHCSLNTWLLTLCHSNLSGPYASSSLICLQLH